ncbi:DUF7548 family protein [Halegenticoccus tardaugens]|uniref:DUF7548 family protein n=1 Tax=Halegenticoccus tardaugens TaxID=2071624 RepID=UPI00100C0D9F|nr:hypothetical protein [Halegenticoccus tardaugens]
MSDRERPARASRASLAAAGLAALAVLALVVAPFFDRGTGVWVYYSAWFAGPLTVGFLAALFAVVAVLGFVTGVRQSTVAGLALGVGVSMIAVTIVWAVNTRRQVVFALSTVDLFRYHRWALLGFALAVALCSTWYAATVYERRTSREV